jgi:hypothetical protein
MHNAKQQQPQNPNPIIEPPIEPVLHKKQNPEGTSYPREAGESGRVHGLLELQLS